MAGYLVTVGLQLPQQLFADTPFESLTRPGIVTGADQLQAVLAPIVLALAAAVLAGRLRSQSYSSAQRRVLAAVYAYGLSTLLFLPLTRIVLRDVLGATPEQLFAVQLVVFSAMPFVFAAGIFRGGFARTAEIEELGTWLGAWQGDAGSGHTVLRDALAVTLGDPSLHLLFPRPGSEDYIDPGGTAQLVPPAGSGRAGVEIDGRDGPAAVIVYDTTLIADPDLVRSAGRVVALALDRERLNAELIAGREAVRQSRTRIIQAADAERRRIALDLHDLLQSRLLLAAMHAGRLAASTEPASTSRDRATRLRLDLDVAITELRGLVQGVMPPLLLERGLYRATQELVDRMPIPALVRMDADHPLPPIVASTAYSILAEALSNVVKHASASRVDVRLAHADGILVLEVQDDGVGGAPAAGGTGLRGMRDRVEAQDGRLMIESPAGLGTHITVELPCAS